MRTFLEVFIPLFVAMDPLGLVPVFLAVTGEMDERQRRRVSLEAAGVATIVCILFMVLGNNIFNFLGISSADFKIGGGILLLVLAVLDILMVGKPAVQETDLVGVVPLGMPMIAGPATLTTILVLSSREQFGYGWTALGLGANLLLITLMLLLSSRIARLLGMNTLRAFSKLVMVLLAAIAVNFIRTGIVEAFPGLGK